MWNIVQNKLIFKYHFNHSNYSYKLLKLIKVVRHSLNLEISKMILMILGKKLLRDWLIIMLKLKLHQNKLLHRWLVLSSMECRLVVFYWLSIRENLVEDRLVQDLHFWIRWFSSTVLEELVQYLHHALISQYRIQIIQQDRLENYQ